MYNTQELYRLSFVSLSRRPRTKPQIVFTIKAEHLDEISKRLQRVVEIYTSHAEEYCSPETFFTFPNPDLFGNLEFGYERCGFVTIENGEAHLRIELASEACLYCATLTIHVLTQALAIPFDEGNNSNHLQQADLETRCDKGEVYGHAVGGYVSSQVMAWLQAYGKKSQDMQHAPEEVLRAMRQVWRTVTQPTFHKWTKECRAYIYPDGRFMLGCFGNACDLAIYPDSLHPHTEEFGVRFNCHNLDSADQQVTLIAGLAKLCELARRSEET